VLLLALASPASAVSYISILAATVALSAIGVTVRPEKDWISLFALIVAAATIVAPGLASFPYFRYLLGVVPILALATAATILGYARGRGWLVAVLAFLFVTTNFFQLLPFHAVRPAAMLSDSHSVGYAPINKVVASTMLRQDGESPLFDFLAGSYLFELTHDYDGPLEQVSAYIERNGGMGDSLLAFSGRFTLRFHTDLDIRGSLEEGFPDWILFHSAGRPRWPSDTRAEIGAHYIPVDIDVADQYWENIPEPHWHRFRSGKPEEGRRVTLLRKVR
jgi:hypothetical protein